MTFEPARRAWGTSPDPKSGTLPDSVHVRITKKITKFIYFVIVIFIAWGTSPSSKLGVLLFSLLLFNIYLLRKIGKSSIEIEKNNDFIGNVIRVKLISENNTEEVEWGQRDLNPRPHDYQSCAPPG